MGDSDRFYDSLVETVHAALLGEAGWQDFVERLNGMTSGALTSMLVHDRADDSSALGFVAGAAGREAALQQYETHYCRLNPWMTRAEIMPVGQGIVGEHLVSRKAFENSEYYYDYLRNAGLESGFGLAIFKDKSRYFVLNTLTGDHDVERNLARATLLTRLSPHLRRAFDIYRSAGSRSAALQMGDSIGSALNLGLLVVDEQLRVLKATAEAESALASGKEIGLNPLSQVRFADPALQNAARHLLKRGISASGYRDATTGIQLIRVGGTDATEFFAGPVLVILLDNKANAVPGLDDLTLRFRMTPAEARVFAAIVAGDSVARIAETAGVTRDTVRAQLKSLYVKTQTHSQSDLVRLATGILRQN